MKVETYLRMAGLPYEVVEANPLQGPKGKLPFIEEDGRRIADSRFIVEYLKQTHGDSVDGLCSHAQRTQRTNGRMSGALVGHVLRCGRSPSISEARSTCE